MEPEIVSKIWKGKKYYEMKLPGGKTKKIPSVTNILGQLDKPALKQWAVNCAVNHMSQELFLIGQKGVSQVMEGSEIVRLEVDAAFLKKTLESAKKAHEVVSQKAKDTGTEVHDYIETYLKTGKEPEKIENEQAKNGFNSFLKWTKEVKFEFIGAEVSTLNKKFLYAGTIDCICKINGKKYIIDFKTSVDFFPEYPIQIAAYTYSYNQEHPEDKIKGIGVLRLDKATGEAHWKDYSKNAKYYLGMFLNLCMFYKLNQDVKEAIKNESAKEKIA